jgi:hypothetical protein
MNFGIALALLQSGHTVHRPGWCGTYLTLQVPDAHSKMTHPYIFITDVAVGREGPTLTRVPWTPSQRDILASDWILGQPLKYEDPEPGKAPLKVHANLVLDHNFVGARPDRADVP